MYVHSAKFVAVVLLLCLQDNLQESLLSQQEYSALIALGGLTNYKIIYPTTSSEDTVSFNFVYKLTYTYIDFKTSVTEKFYNMIQFK